MSLRNYFLGNKGKKVHKWLHYLPIYEKHFSSFVGKSPLVFEIGVSAGGSLQMWNNYFGENCTIVGLDINESCKNLNYESEQIHIRIGDQKDINFLQSVINEFGMPDIVLDDGSHIMDDINRTFDFLYPKMIPNSIYMIEDLHTCYWKEFGGEIENENTIINRTKGFIDLLNAYWTRGKIEPNDFTNQTTGIHIYDSIICFEKGLTPIRSAPSIG